VGRLDVPLLCLDHGLRDPSANKPYEIRPIEDVVKSPAMVEIIKAYANGELPHAASQAATWHINSGVSWEALATKLTGTERNINRQSYFSRDQLTAAVAIVQRAQSMTEGLTLQPRHWKSPSQKLAEQPRAAPAEESYQPKQGKVIEEDLDAEVPGMDEPATSEPAVSEPAMGDLLPSTK
jgi:hypothetical protein